MKIKDITEKSTPGCFAWASYLQWYILCKYNIFTSYIILIYNVYTIDMCSTYRVYTK